MRTLTYPVTAEYEGKKVLHLLKSHAGLSSKLIRSLKAVDHGICLNDTPVRTIDLLHEGDVLTLHLPDDLPKISGAGFQPDALDILYEDEDLIVINKPPTLAIHPSHNHQGDTLANLLAAHLDSVHKTAAFRAVGRLDKGTSGIVVCALNSFAAAKLQGKVQKYYYAVPTGRYEGTGTINAPIYRPDPLHTYRVTDERGVPAVTHYETLASADNLSLVKVTLETGRTHQIRVHFASLGTPLLGDTMYGTPDARIGHQALHCAHADLVQPYTGELLSVSAPFPEDLEAVVTEAFGFLPKR